MRKVCTKPTCPVHHSNKQTSKADASFKAEQEKRRREEALANAIGIRVLQTIVAAVPVRLMKHDLVFLAEQLLRLLDERCQESVARNRGIKAKEGESAAKLLAVFIHETEEGTLGKLIVESVVLLSARTQVGGDKILRAAAQVYGVDTEAIALKVKQEFAAKDRARNPSKPEPKPLAKAKQLA
jgi:ParB family chromosome partitioning protein